MVSTAQKTRRFSTGDICIMAMLTVILFLQEQLLAFLPNIQLTVFLILLYAKCLGTGRSMLIVTAYLLLDAVFNGAVNPIFVAAQLIGWLSIPLLARLVKTEDSIRLAFLALLGALLYSWVMLVPGMLVFHLSFKAYFLADLLFECLLAGSSFLSTLLLYDPMSRLLRRLLGEEKT